MDGQTSSVETKKQSELSKELDLLHNRMSQGLDKLALLEEKLKPILRIIPEGLAKNEVEKSLGPNTMIGGSIRAASDKLSDIVNRISKLVNNLEV